MPIKRRTRKKQVNTFVRLFISGKKKPAAQFKAMVWASGNIVYFNGKPHTAEYVEPEKTAGCSLRFDVSTEVDDKFTGHDLKRMLGVMPEEE